MYLISFFFYSRNGTVNHGGRQWHASWTGDPNTEYCFSVKKAELKASCHFPANRSIIANVSCSNSSGGSFRILDNVWALIQMAIETENFHPILWNRFVFSLKFLKIIEKSSLELKLFFENSKKKRKKMYYCTVFFPCVIWKDIVHNSVVILFHLFLLYIYNINYML